MGVTGGVEIGGALGWDKTGINGMIGFKGGCGGGAIGTELEGASFNVILGVWNDLGSIPGNSFTIGKKEA